MILQAVFWCLLMALVGSDVPTPTEPKEVLFIRSHLAKVIGQLNGAINIPDVTHKFFFGKGSVMVKTGKYKGLDSLKIRNPRVIPATSSEGTIITAPALKKEVPVIVEFELYFNDISIRYEHFVARHLFEAFGQWKSNGIKNLFKITLTFHPKDRSGKDCKIEINDISIVQFEIKDSITCRWCFGLFLLRRPKTLLKNKIQTSLMVDLIQLLNNSLARTPLTNMYNGC